MNCDGCLFIPITTAQVSPWATDPLFILRRASLAFPPLFTHDLSSQSDQPQRHGGAPAANQLAAGGIRLCGELSAGRRRAANGEPTLGGETHGTSDGDQ